MAKMQTNPIIVSIDDNGLARTLLSPGKLELRNPDRTVAFVAPAEATPRQRK